MEEKDIRLNAALYAHEMILATLLINSAKGAQVPRQYLEGVRRALVTLMEGSPLVQNAPPAFGVELTEKISDIFELAIQGFQEMERQSE